MGTQVYADWSQPCIDMAPAWEKAATKLRAVVRFGRINSDEVLAVRFDTASTGFRALPVLSQRAVRACDAGHRASVSGVRGGESAAREQHSGGHRLRRPGRFGRSTALCIYVCIHTYTYAHTHIHTNTHIHTYTHTHTRTHARTHARTHTHTHERTHARTHTHTHTHRRPGWFIRSAALTATHCHAHRVRHAADSALRLAWWALASMPPAHTQMLRRMIHPWQARQCQQSASAPPAQCGAGMRRCGWALRFAARWMQEMRVFQGDKESPEQIVQFAASLLRYSVRPSFSAGRRALGLRSGPP